MSTHDDILREADSLDTNDTQEIMDYIDSRIEEEGISEELDQRAHDICGE